MKGERDAGRVLVTGGQGYIGRHVVWQLLQEGCAVVSLDRRPAPPSPMPGERAIELDLLEATIEALARLLQDERIDGVIHLAALTEVGESTRDPLRYYHENLGATLALLRAMSKVGVDRLVFASSAAVYGDPGDVCLTESSPLAPVNPYGESKVIVERILDDLVARGKLRAVSLRLFNVAGVGPTADLRRAPQSLGLIMPLLLHVVGRGTPMTADEQRRAGVIARGFATADGTAVRDYVHVSDVARAFGAALAALSRDDCLGRYVVATGRSHSVAEVVAAVAAVSEEASTLLSQLRWAEPPAGFPAVLRADPSRAERQLGLRCQLASLRAVIDSLVGVSSETWR